MGETYRQRQEILLTPELAEQHGKITTWRDIDIEEMEFDEQFFYRAGLYERLCVQRVVWRGYRFENIVVNEERETFSCVVPHLRDDVPQFDPQSPVGAVVNKYIALFVLAGRARKKAKRGDWCAAGVLLERLARYFAVQECKNLRHFTEGGGIKGNHDHSHGGRTRAEAYRERNAAICARYQELLSGGHAGDRPADYYRKIAREFKMKFDAVKKVISRHR